MSKINDGGPAFPGEESVPGHMVYMHQDGTRSEHEYTMDTKQPGMTLRDWFAGQALAGIVSIEKIFNDIDEDEVADLAYSQADKMIAARTCSLTDKMIAERAKDATE